MNLERALEAALKQIIIPRGGRINHNSSAHALYDSEIPLWGKTALIYMLGKKLERNGVVITYDMFTPYLAAHNVEETILVSQAHIPRQTPQGVLVDSMLTCMADDLSPQLARLLEAHSPRAGREDGRMVVSVEIKKIVSSLDFQVLEKLDYTLCMLAQALSRKAKER